MLPFRHQILGHLIVALLLALLLNMALSPAGERPDTEQTPAPFTTQAEMMAVTVAVYQDRPPQILDVQALDAGRVTVTQPGPYTLTLGNERDASLYNLSFRVAFSVPGLPGEANEARQMFVLPAGEQAAHLMLDGPQGSATYDLE